MKYLSLVFEKTLLQFSALCCIFAVNLIRVYTAQFFFFLGGEEGITKKETRKYTALVLDNSDTQSGLKGN